jgi:hypothetical protein
MTEVLCRTQKKCTGKVETMLTLTDNAKCHVLLSVKTSYFIIQFLLNIPKTQCTFCDKYCILYNAFTQTDKGKQLSWVPEQYVTANFI